MKWKFWWENYFRGHQFPSEWFHTNDCVYIAVDVALFSN